jgi:Cu2+-exporting ATPase
LRVESSQVLTDYAEALEELLHGLPEVHEIRFSPGCRSVILTYDAERSSATSLLSRLRQLSLDQLKAHPGQPRRALPADSDLPSWLPVGFSTTALAFSMFVGASFAPWLIAGAALPLFARAYDALIRKAELNGAVLDAGATTVLLLNGQAPAAALMLWLTVLGDVVHSLTKRQARETVTQLSEGASYAEGEKDFELRSLGFHETPMQREAEQFARRTVPVSLVAASTAFATGNENIAAAFLIANYDTALQVTVPTTIVRAMQHAVSQGVLFGSGYALERMAAVDAVVFDKTGVLTQGIPDVVEVIPYGKKLSPERVLALAAAAEKDLAHPLAEATSRAVHARGLTIPEREATEFRSGLGVEAVVEGTVVLVGSQRFMQQKRVPLQRARKDLRELDNRPASPVFVAADGKLIGVLALVDPLRQEARAVVESLRERGVQEVVLLTGDRVGIAAALAEQGGISRYLADVFPEERTEFVRSLQQEGRTVAVVTSGRSPSPAAVHADVSIALGGRGGSPLASERTIFLDGDLSQIPRTLEVAREGVTVTQQNRNLVFCAHTIALVLSLLGVVEPLGTVLLSKGSTALAMGNALRSFRRMP